MPGWDNYPVKPIPEDKDSLIIKDNAASGERANKRLLLSGLGTWMQDKLRAMIGSPLTASLAADMTDRTRIYVYVGSESGYTNGNWYYHNGTSWISGGVYNSTAFETDKTLTQADQAADAKKVGDEVTDLKSAISFPPELVWAYSDTHYIATGNSVTSIDVSSPYTESSTYHGKADFRPCLPGDVFIATLSAGTNSARPYIFCDSSGNVIEKSTTAAMTNKRIVAPNNAVYVGFNANGVNDSVKIGEDKLAQLDNRCNSIEDQIESIEDAIGNVSMLVFDKTSRYYVNVGNSTTQIDTSAPYAYSDSYNGKSDFRQCSQDDVFVVTLTPPSASIRTYGFCSSDGTIIEKSETGTINNKRIVAPENATYVWFNSNNSSDAVQIGERTTDALSYELDERCGEIEQNVSDIEDSLGSVSQLVWEYTDTHYINTKTSPKDVSAPYSISNTYHGNADWRACNAGDVFIVSLKGSTNYVPYIFCDSSGNILVRASNVQYHNERIVAPPGTAYVGFNSDPSDAYGTVQLGEYVFDKLQAEIDEASNKQFDGMSGVAFGTSLTYKAQTDNGYLQYLPTLSGIDFDNQGIGSATIKSGILNAIKGYTGYANKNICILEGFVNDWSGNNSLGTYTDNTETTVCGCVRSAINYIMAQNTQITLFLVLDHYGKNSSLDRSSTAVNGAGLTQYQYYEEIAKVAESLGIPVIKQYAGSQIGENTPQYLTDYIHCTALGAKQSAYFIWSQMKQYYPNVVS